MRKLKQQHFFIPIFVVGFFALSILTTAETRDFSRELISNSETEEKLSEEHLRVKNSNRNSLVVTEGVITKRDEVLIFASSYQDIPRNDVIEKKSLNDSLITLETLGGDKFLTHKKRIFLSPDRKLIAVTVENYYSHEPLLTYITDIAGNPITSAHPGYFVSWLPDNEGIMLFLSGFEPGIHGRQIYYLNTDNQYYDSGLPIWTSSADTSINGNIVYNLTKAGTDESSLYVRNVDLQDKILLEGDNEVFSWPYWSPRGEKIAFLRSDLAFRKENNEIWIINSDGSNPERISNVNIAYPPVWSKDGNKLLFANNTDVWEYDLNKKSPNSLTNFSEGFVQHPSYSADEKTIVFSREINGEKQIWSVEVDNSSVKQLTSDNSFKSYPLIP